jgi:hypothetical protein
MTKSLSSATLVVYITSDPKAKADIPVNFHSNAVCARNSGSCEIPAMCNDVVHNRVPQKYNLLPHDRKVMYHVYLMHLNTKSNFVGKRR